MELSREAYQLIIQNVGSRSDLYALTRVSKAFQRAAERALYNTLLMRNPTTTIILCNTLAANARLAILVDALTVFASPAAPVGEDEGEEEDGNGGSSEPERMGDSSLPGGFWDALAAALRQTNRLRFLNIHVDGDASNAWVLRGCAFRLRSFHCDLAWDADLVEFLDMQDQMRDLYLADYAAPSQPTPQPEAGREHEPQPQPQPQAVPATTLRAGSLSVLSTLECSFIEAVTALAPGRPVVRVKTCFSREDTPGKTAELRQLGASLRHASARVCSLDLADSSYTEEFSLAVLALLVPRLTELRYLGTLVLPVGLERLQFFGLLMRLRRLHTVELEVSEWEPAPTPQALRALASELRLYCPSIMCVVFVQDFERTVVRTINGFCAVDPDASADNLWRDVRVQGRGA
ncbi:hypothetical protein M0805_008503 [Coniferiporia weirii]|nr:hypothetical protein M0805_008503 [Coniferiporia weirii]